jgi:hypothetical protein
MNYWVWDGKIVWPSGSDDVGNRAPWFVSEWNQDENNTFSEGFVMRFYRYSDWDIYDYIIEEIEPESWHNQVIELMFEHTGIRIGGIWYESNGLLIVNLMPIERFPFDWGSTGGGIRASTLLRSLSSLPNVSNILVLMGGQYGAQASHFNFQQIFRVNEWVE